MENFDKTAEGQKKEPNGNYRLKTNKQKMPQNKNFTGYAVQ